MATSLIDCTGKQYGDWTILKELGGNTVLCRCVCGTEKIVSKMSVRSGGSCSCGCTGERALKDLIGKIFGNLTVLSYKRDIKRDIKRVYLECQCKCGTIRLFRADGLTSGKKKSCGCLRREKSLSRETGSVGLRCLFGDYKYRAKKRSLKFELTMEQFKELTSQNCFYCDIEPSQISGSPSGEHTNYRYTGLDQIIPGTGYLIGSVVPCCWKCNTAKLKMSQGDFKAHIKKIYKFWAFKEKICEPSYDFINVSKERCISLLCAYKNKRGLKGLPFNLTPEQFYYLLKQNCFYCGTVPYRKRGSFLFNGVDRIDSKKGYELGNVCSSCFACNSAKSTMTQEEFKNHIVAIYEHWASK